MKNKILYLIIACSITKFAAATSVLASSYGWNAADATNAITAAINSNYDTVIVDKQSSAWIVKPLAFFSIKPKFILFESGVAVQAKANAFPNTGDQLFGFYNCSNTTLYGYGATFKMRKQEYTDGEWRHCVELGSCNNFSVLGLILRDSGGDGVAIEEDYNNQHNPYCTNITIRDCVMDNNKRQGVSVISCDGLLIENCVMKNTNGTPPSAGIDFEPDHNYHRIVNCTMRKCKLINNDGEGIQISLYALDNSSKQLSITIDSCIVSNNKLACASATSDNSSIKGSINISNCTFKNSDYEGLYVRKSITDFDIVLNNCSFINVANSTDQYVQPLTCEVMDYSNPCPRFGGVAYNNCYVEFTKNTPFFMAYDWPQTSQGLANISGHITVKNTNAQLPPNFGYNGSNPKNVTLTYEFVATAITSVKNDAGKKILAQPNK